MLAGSPIVADSQRYWEAARLHAVVEVQLS